MTPLDELLARWSRPTIGSRYEVIQCADELRPIRDALAARDAALAALVERMAHDYKYVKGAGLGGSTLKVCKDKCPKCSLAAIIGGLDAARKRTEATIEVKGCKGEQSRAQMEFQSEIEKAGGEYLLVRSAMEVERWLAKP